MRSHIYKIIHSLKFKEITGAFALLLCFGNSAFAKAPGESDFVGASLTGNQIANWVLGLPHTPKDIGVFSVRTHAPLDPDFSEIMDAQIKKSIQAITSIRVIECEECHTPQVQVRGDRLMVTMGAPDLEAIKDLGKKLGVETFLTVEVYRTKLSMVSQVSLYESISGIVIASEEFKIPTFELEDASAQVSFKFGPGLGVGGRTSSDDPANNNGSPTPPLALSISLLEELGFGKGGLTFATAWSDRGNLLVILPTLAWRGRFGATAMTSLKGFGLGFGKSGPAWGPAGSFSYDVYLGTFTSVGFIGYLVLPSRSSVNEADKGLSAFIGINVGFSMGR